MDKQTKQIFYLGLGGLCIWVVLSEFFGGKYISTALLTLFPSLMKDE